MAEHFFGLFNGKVTQRTCDRINKTLKDAEVDAHICVYNDPAQGSRGWMATWNRGEPFNSVTAREAIRVLEAAGLWEDGRPVR